jgi:hypothetical protein
MMKTCKILMVIMIPMWVHAQTSVHSSWGEGTGTGGRMTYSMGQVQALLNQNGAVVGTTTTDALVAMRHFTGAMTLTRIRLQAGNGIPHGAVTGQEAMRITQRMVDRNLPFLSGDWAFAPTQVQVQFGDTLVNVPVSALCYGDVNASYFPALSAQFAGDSLLAVGRLDKSNSDTWEWPIYLTESKSIGAMTVELILGPALALC